MIRKPILVLLCLLAAASTGCIKAGSELYVRYDKEKDSFTYLHVFTDIATENVKELAYLHALHQEKSRILVAPVPAFLGAPAAFVRLDATAVHEVSLDSPPGDFKDKLTFPMPIKFPVDLAPIKVRPGKFFLNERKNLCYYHEIDVPGAVADQLLIYLNKKMNEQLVEELDRMIKAEGDAKLPRVSWDDLRKFWAEDIRNQVRRTEPDPKEDDKQVNGPFELASLKELRKSAAANKLAIKRKGARITFDAPLTAQDAKQMETTLGFSRKVLIEELEKKDKDERKTTADDKKKLAAWKKVLAEAVSYKVEPAGIRVEMELTSWFALVNLHMEIDSRQPIARRFVNFDAKMEADYREKCQAVVNSIQERRVEILRDFDRKKLTASYLNAAK
ncbi:MAG: hypothetical protein HY289_00395 [Planctomycetes bacterium]|nr:hypothetical protein [Planctomycetota bacterium]